MNIFAKNRTKTIPSPTQKRAPIRNLTLSASLALALTACSGSKTAQESAVTGVSYVGVTVSDLEQSVEMYMNTVGLQDVQSLNLENVTAFSDITGREGVSAQTRMLSGVNAQLRYMQFENTTEAGLQTSAVPVQGPGIAHVCFQVNGETGAYPKFLEQGAQHIGAKEMVQINPKNPVEYAYAKDKDGIVIEIEHVDISKLNLETLPDHDYRIRHVSFATPDIKRLGNFYGKLLGQPKPRRIGRFGGIGNEAISQVSGLADTKIKMTWFQLRNLEIELIQYTSHPTDPLSAPRPLDAVGYNMIVFDVSDLDAAKRTFIDAGGTIISGPHSLDGGQIIFGRDPDLNLIGLQIPAPGSIVSSAQFKNNGS